MRNIFIILLILLTAGTVWSLELNLPDGFRVHVFAENVPGARQMTQAPDGTIFVGSRNEGNIYAVKDTDGDFRADKVTVIAEGLDMPNGVAFRQGSLYAAEIHRIIRFDNILKNIREDAPFKVDIDGLPEDEHHGWKYIDFGPAGYLYVPVGVPCNVCDKENEVFGTILRFKTGNPNYEIYAKGVRNSVGFDWNPKTGKMWFTDNGRDWMGDNKPADELNRVSQKGEHFGFPYCHEGDLPDPKFGEGVDCSQFKAPKLKIQAHAAALGIKFYTGEMFPKKYRNGAFIALHGSWNRSSKVGYKVIFVPVADKEAGPAQDFLTGFLQGEDYFGRPVAFLQLDDGSLLVSDDYGGTIYRITYER